MKEKIIKRLIELINYYYFNYYKAASISKLKKESVKQEVSDGEEKAEVDEELADVKLEPSNDLDQQGNLVDLTNQLVIIFGSFSLGSLEHVTKLIKFYSLHEIMFNLMRILNCDNNVTAKKISNGKIVVYLFINVMNFEAK